MAETLGLPTWQVDQMVQDLRAKQKLPNAPISSSMWLKTRLWLWAGIAILVIGMSGAVSRGFNFAPPNFRPPVRANRTQTDGIYPHEVAQAGRDLGLKAPPGFSYRIKYGTLDAAANGDSKHYVPADELSPENVAIMQEQYTNDIIDGFGKAIAKAPPEWVNGDAVGAVKPNYYDAGLADWIDITLNKDAFPYDPASSAGKQLHDKLLQDIKEHWDDILD